MRVPGACFRNGVSRDQRSYTSAAARAHPPAASFPLPTKVPSVPFSVSSTAMSDKLKEFIDIPQQFIRDGNQVCYSHRTPNRNGPNAMPW